MRKFLKYFICASLLAGIGVGVGISANRVNSNEVKQTYADSSDFELYSYNTSTSSYSNLYSGTSVTDFSSAISQINNWATGGKIKLLKNIVVPGNHWLLKKTIIDLNGHNIYCQDTSKSFVLGYRDGLAAKAQAQLYIQGSGTIEGSVIDAVIFLDGGGTNASLTGTDLASVYAYIQDTAIIKHTGSSGRGIVVHDGGHLEIQSGAFVFSTTSHGVYADGGVTNIAGHVEGASSSSSIYDVYVTSNSSRGTNGRVYLQGASADVDYVFVQTANAVFALDQTYTNMIQLHVRWSSGIAHNDTWYPFSNVNIAFKDVFHLYFTLEFQYSNHYGLTWETVSTAYGKIKATIKNYTIKYHPNGGNGTLITDTVKAMDNYTVRENMFTHDGYVSFKRWNTKSDDTGTWYDGNEYIDDGVAESMVLYAIWVKLDHNYYDEFSIEYLHMNDYDSTLTGSGDGSCIAYYALAKDYFENTMTKNQRVNFSTYLNNQYANAWARFNEWARINGETISLVNGDYVISSNRSINPINLSSSNINVIVIISTISMILISGAIIATLKMKKKHE